MYQHYSAAAVQLGPGNALASVAGVLQAPVSEAKGPAQQPGHFDGAAPAAQVPGMQSAVSAVAGQAQNAMAGPAPAALPAW